MNFELTLHFNPNDLRNVSNANQKVALAKPTIGGTVEVLWVDFAPLENNTITWSENYSIYASTTSLAAPGTVITKKSEVAGGSASTGALYLFENNGTFSGPTVDRNVGNSTFSVRNDMSYERYPYLTFGLLQSAEVNAKPEINRPISATSVLATQTIRMTPLTNVYIWLEAHFSSSSIITTVEGNKSSATFGGGVDSIALVYDPKTGKFHQ